MKKFVSALLLLCLALSLCSCGDKKEEKGTDMEEIKKAGVIRVGMECDYAPFNWMTDTPTATSAPIEGGNYADGYDLYFSAMVAEALGVDIQVVKLEWSGLSLALESGTIDVIIAGMSATEERKQTIDFTMPYYYGQKVVLVQKGGKYEGARSLDDFSGASITGQLNSLHYDLIDQIPDVDKQLPFENLPTMIVALQSGATDGFITDIDVAKSICLTNPDITFVSFPDGEGFEVDETRLNDCIGCRKGSDLVAFINDILKDIPRSRLTELMDKAIAEQPAGE